MKTLLLIDFSNTVIRSLAVHPMLTSPHGEPTGGLFGFVGQIANQLSKHQPTHVLVCKDAPPYLRKKMYPTYKSDRAKNRDTEKSQNFFAAMNISFKQVDECLKYLDIPAWSVPGLEADDLIAATIQRHVNDYDKIIILSNDDDLFQLLVHENVFLLKKNKEFGYKEFKELYPDINPDMWLLVTALAGTHNAVSGIPRIGIKTAIKIINDDQKLIDVYEKHEDLIKQNLILIELPLAGYCVKDLVFMDLKTPVINETLFIRFLDQYGIRYSTQFMESVYPYSSRRIQV